jgi:alpha/beta superfamily hydrolase
MTLIGVLHRARTQAAAAPAVVVCHPHPLYGGSMENNVVGAVCEALATAGIHALRFNFRGVGGSGGHYGEGIAEQADVRGALDYLAALENVDPKRLGLCGYSFGGMVTTPVAINDTRVRALGLVSPAMDAAALNKLADFTRPLIVFGGALDDLLTPALLSANLAAPPVIIPGADHFWWDHEAALAAALTDFFEASL